MAIWAHETIITTTISDCLRLICGCLASFKRAAFLDVVLHAHSTQMKTRRTLVGVTVVLSLISGNAAAVDSWQLVKETICSDAKLDATKALQASFFEFKRQDGFECAQRVLAALTTDIVNSADSKLGSSRLLWAMFAAAKADANLDSSFKTITTAIRATNDHPLRGEARLAQLRLSVFRGKSNAQIAKQIEPIVVELGLFRDRQSLNKLYASGSVPLRESLRWLLAVYAQERIDAMTAPSGLEERLRAHARWGQEATIIGAAVPELLHSVIAEAWRGGRQLVSSGQLPLIDTSRALPEISGRLEYSLCANGKCRDQVSNVAKVSDQVDEKREFLDITHALAAIRYSIDSTPIVQSACALNGAVCTKEEIEEAGRHYWLSVSSVVVGGAAWKDSFWKEAKGIDDRSSSISYDFKGQVTIPQCTNPARCSPTVIVAPRMTEEGHDSNALRSIALVGPDGSETLLPTNSLTAVDRSSGPNTIQFKLSRVFQQSGSTAAPANQSTISVSIWSGTKLSQPFIAVAKEALSKSDSAMTNYLPILLMTRALTLRPALVNEAPGYMGLGEALGLYSDKNTATRWDRIYAPLYFTHLLQTTVAPELIPEERQGLDLARKSLSRVAIDNFSAHVDQQISLLKDLLLPLSVATIDDAIVKIQKEQPLDAAVGPLMQAVLTIPGLWVGLGDESISQAKELINTARSKDNLLDAVLLLYQARERMQQAHERVSLQLELLSVEKSGLVRH